MQHRSNLTSNKMLFGLSLISVSILSACGGSSNTTAPEPEFVPVTSPPNLEQRQTSDAALSTPGASAVSLYIKNGVYLNAQQQIFGFPEVVNTFNDAAASGARGFSQTNTQEVGVDEADRIEYNGEYAFSADVPVWYPEDGYSPKVRVLARQDDDSLQEVASLDIPETYNVGGLYLADDKLGVITQSAPSYPIDIFRTSFFAPIGTGETKVTLDVYGVSDPSSPVSDATVSIDGSLVNSRRIGDDIYLIMQYIPVVEDLVVGAENDDDLVDNYNALLRLDDEELIPSITINDIESPLFSLDDCAIPSDVKREEGNAQLVTVVKIDLNNPANFDATCLSAEANNLYMSAQNIYLTAGYSDTTTIHKVGLDSLSYNASGTVDGIINGRGAANLRLSEHDGNLRILTTNYDDFSDPEHKLFVLAEESNSLDVISELPNDAEPAPIGKVGEDVYAVRYFGDKAYVVTFERIDPLYVLDLSDALAPKIAGSLEIPGFSSYLHPIGENLVLGIGQEVSPNNLPDNGNDVIILPTTNGMKVSLFDVVDPQNPVVRAERVWENAYTPIEFNYLALSVLQEGDLFKFALPVERWLQDGNLFRGTEYSLVGLEVDANAMTMEQAMQLVVKSEDDLYIYSGEDRSIIHGDNVYYLRGNSFWHGTWSATSELSGPY
ncbi:beta-propeller domain-containing protein [Agaribacter marinus]|uniref:Beta propeller domain-containing protein n=1 Tax=Agaribacter marinus TaxID=1431249 RepID=A0AA37WKU9_9ALTE|nr:beta-propeller domain-containing protein [Agaribacter marinus]GLR71255.1 hypothetical protein GCM10007852_21630 [Agaribacter marinus]